MGSGTCVLRCGVGMFLWGVRREETYISPWDIRKTSAPRVCDPNLVPGRLPRVVAKLLQEREEFLVRRFAAAAPVFPHLEEKNGLMLTQKTLRAGQDQ